MLLLLLDVQITYFSYTKSMLQTRWTSHNRSLALPCASIMTVAANVIQLWTLHLFNKMLMPVSIIVSITVIRLYPFLQAFVVRCSWNSERKLLFAGYMIQAAYPILRTLSTRSDSRMFYTDSYNYRSYLCSHARTGCRFQPDSSDSISVYIS